MRLLKKVLAEPPPLRVGGTEGGFLRAAGLDPALTRKQATAQIQVGFFHQNFEVKIPKIGQKTAIFGFF